ncbi:cadherin-86C isoform X2 [Pieris brassicae]|uniref:cadherin-86C isoform X2 n=1 Tax=Pieris brassicae TaxID=7116 RepID=UPI001E66118F|nr:cadherin-86C isoform X2 [Pieris brassicae]
MTFTLSLVLVPLLFAAVHSGEPVFDPSTLMRLVQVPADAAVGSVIYRVRASDPDFDYPLHFELIGQMGRLDIGIESLPCTRYNSVCQANVILLRRLEPGRYVDFRLSARNTRGRSARIACSITGTNATTPRDTIFPHQPSIILVPEDAKRGTDLEIVIARKNPVSSKPLELELWGSPLFAIRQRRVSTENTEGTIFLVGPLDFEAQSMYHLTLLAVDPYVELGKDTRNIAGLEVVVVVQDVQDMPPVFTSAPPITHLPRQVAPGDVVVKVRAEDGDKGAPRQIRYGLVSEGNPFTPFFNINETSGEVSLERPIEEIAAISHAGTPILLTVVAEEVRLSREEPEAMSSTVQLAFILPERDNSPPYFENESYITYLDENAPQGTALTFSDPFIPQVNDNDAGKNGVFSLSLLGNNGTFEISPTVAERHAQFIIKVRDNTMLDFEARKSVICQILAQELGPATNLSATANVTVYLNDVNDNAPVFLALSYEVELPENITAGARVVQVQADDVDTGDFGKIQYTAILGYQNTSLNLDPISGWITVATNNHGFDREAMPDLHFLVEARDNDGVGLRVTVPLIIKLLDVNDNPPEFERTLYEFVLSPSLSNFTSSAFVKAVDKDAEPPNNLVRYEIIEGNKDGKFAVNEGTGELYLLEPLKRTKKDNARRRKRDNDEDSEVFVLTIRAYDLGIPRLSSTTTVKIYPPESKTRTMSFIIPGSNPDRKKLEELLSTLSGGKVNIIEIKPYKGNDYSTSDQSDQSSQEKSEVIAVVRSSQNSAINVAKLQEQLAKNKTVYTTGVVPNDQTSTSNKDESSLYRAENRLLFWLLILLAVLVALVLLLLICCCICEGCPLYMPPRDGPKIIYTKEMQLQQAFANKHKEYIEDLENGYDRIATLHHRKEQDNDSIRRHEIDRGSDAGIAVKSEGIKNTEDKDENRSKVEYHDKVNAPTSLARDQYFIRDGNTEILRLVTRGHNEEERYVNLPVHQQRPVTLIPQTQYVVVDNGKELLMERFIREQGEEAKHIRERMNSKLVTDLDDISIGKAGQGNAQNQYDGSKLQDYNNLQPEVPGTVPLKAEYLQSALLDIQNKSTINQELLETSLRKQNELLHQILVEREKMLQNQETASQVESKLETQSLPGHSVMATQTECHIGTQTEPQVFNDIKRKSRSDNDSYSEDESQISAKDDNRKPTWLKRKKSKKKIKYKDPRRSMRTYDVKRKIKTPILEESEASPSLDSEKHVKISKTNEREEHTRHFGDVTKSTVITSKNETMCSTKIKLGDLDRKEKLRKEILLEISDSLDEKVNVHQKKKLRDRDISPINKISGSLALDHGSSRGGQSVSSSTGKNLKNPLTTDSSTETRDDNNYGKLTKDFEIKDESSSSKKDESKSYKSEESKQGTDAKASLKSLPRYMQWYSKKPAAATSKSSVEKVVPDKPKRPSKTKAEVATNQEKFGRYGKIMPKDQTETEVKKNFKEKESEFIHPRILKEGKVTPVPEGPLPDAHPLLQHSEHRYERQYENQNPLCHIQPTHIPKYLRTDSKAPALPRRHSVEQQPIYVNQDEVRNKDKQEIPESALTHSISISTSYDKERKGSEVHVSKINIGGESSVNKIHTKIDDNDSGIAMTTLAQQTGNIKRLPITEKKSVFTIAYDDVQTKQLRPDSSSTSY